MHMCRVINNKSGAVPHAPCAVLNTIKSCAQINNLAIVFVPS